MDENLPNKWWARGLTEFIVFGVKQAWACLFAGLMLGVLILTSVFWPDHAAVHRYDVILLCAVALQVCMLALKLETWDEAAVILLYHIVGTVMEIFKVSVGSWIYPEDAIFMVMGVPLFSGFMYASVGSYIARVIRVMDIRFYRYPPAWQTWILSVAIYLNFFTHHYGPDARYILFGCFALIYLRTRFYFGLHRLRLWMPFGLGAILVAFFLWLAENIGTLTGTWLYPDQFDTWHMVSFAKLGSWLLLIIISFVLVTVVNRPEAE